MGVTNPSFVSSDKLTVTLTMASLGSVPSLVSFFGSFPLHLLGPSIRFLSLRFVQWPETTDVLQKESETGPCMLTMMDNNNSSRNHDNAAKDGRFRSKVQSIIATPQAWDADPSLLMECRAMIPFDVLIPNRTVDTTNDTSNHDEAIHAGRINGCMPTSPYAGDDDWMYQGNVLFLQRLARFFQKDVMTWVNAPDCTSCGAKNPTSTGMRGPETEEEREGGASRVEGMFPVRATWSGWPVVVVSYHSILVSFSRSRTHSLSIHPGLYYSSESVQVWKLLRRSNVSSVQLCPEASRDSTRPVWRICQPLWSVLPRGWL